MDVSSHAKKKFTKTQDLSLALVEIGYVHECFTIRVHLVGCHVNCNSILWLNVHFFYISNVASMEILCHLPPPSSAGNKMQDSCTD